MSSMKHKHLLFSYSFQRAFLGQKSPNHINSDIIKNTIIDWSKFKWASSKLQEIKEFCIIVQEKQRKQYKNVMTKCLWQCKNGHHFMASPNRIQQGKGALNVLEKNKSSLSNPKKVIYFFG